ncbi:ACT domain-containing protein [Paragemmobacter straminiformis]|uniref:ACT domain-containing protein n=1 Tax=Paragemmobacter straminiformis TaxID=2045119 RepID=A0A842I6E6_9RHOB|nr:ACT domain-containing protein [Gemmobacter straminiformis]MBC2835185.1 ACT domain-containing protein [Gemmobacter straminiformis]
MAGVVRDGRAMVAGMSPLLVEGRFAFVTGAPGLLAVALAMFREAEGMSLIVPAAHAPEAVAMRCITLQVQSALDGVGLTAAVATALAAEGIACNMVAAHHHDHVFVPEESAARAVEVLLALQARAAG